MHPSTSMRSFTPKGMPSSNPNCSSLTYLFSLERACSKGASPRGVTSIPWFFEYHCLNRVSLRTSTGLNRPDLIPKLKASIRLLRAPSRRISLILITIAFQVLFYFWKIAENDYWIQYLFVISDDLLGPICITVQSRYAPTSVSGGKRHWQNKGLVGKNRILRSSRTH